VKYFPATTDTQKAQSCLAITNDDVAGFLNAGTLKPSASAHPYVHVMA
jgi:hypothetical protein